MKTYIYSIAVLLLVCACTPQIDDKIELGELPNPSFEITQGASANDFILTNTSNDAFLVSWELGTIPTPDEAEITDNEIELNVPTMGTYPITMRAFNQGGSASISKDLVVTENAAMDCVGNVELLTNCTEKIWRLAPEEGAMHVGPSATETWWGNSADDVVARACHFDDEYIFRENGEFEYDNKGDFWADTDGDGNVWPSDLGLTEGCNVATDWPDSYKAWDSGLYEFAATDNNLTVIGEGAFLGLYKVGTSAEVDTPQQSVSLSILDISDSRMVLIADYGGVVWRFTFVAS